MEHVSGVDVPFKTVFQKADLLEGDELFYYLKERIEMESTINFWLANVWALV